MAHHGPPHSSSIAAGTPDIDPPLQVALRRIVSIGTIVVAALLLLLTAPLWIPLALLLDLTLPGRTSVLGCGFAIGWYLLCEMAGVGAAFWLWLTRRHRADYASANFGLQRWWARTLFRGVERFLGLRLHARGAECAAEGPIFVLPRHVTTLDTLIPTLITSVRYGIHLRVVMKRELLWDPCLDIVGHRLRNAFVQREGGDRQAELERVRELAVDLGRHEGVLIYPEGTRFTPAKRDRVIASLRAKGDDAGARRAESYTGVLPPRYGGVLALLEARPDVDVVFLCHSGLEHVRTIGDLWRGGLRGLVVEARLWRVPASEIPSDAEARKQWLTEQWHRMDERVGQQALRRAPAAERRWAE